MSAPLTSEGDLELVFAWDDRQRRRMAIMGFVLASLMLHALCFYVFQIVYPPAVALLPPPGRATVIAPNTDEARVLLRWLEAEDPALASTTQPPDKKSLSLPTIEHAPSYLMRQPTLRETPPFNPNYPSIPSAQSPGPVESLRPPIPALAQISPTVIRLSSGLEILGPRQSPEMKFAASRHESPQVAQFRVAVNEDGEVSYCFLEDSSGDAALDEQARKYLVLCRFSSIHSPKSEIRNAFTWGTATIEWGNDVVVQPRARTESVAP